MKHSQDFLMFKVTQPILCFWVNLVLVTTLLYFFNVSPMEKLISALTPHTFFTSVSQAVPSAMVLKQGAFYIMFLTFESKHVYQNIKMYSASVFSL